MNASEIFNVVMLLVWLGLLGGLAYLHGYENGERAGRKNGCRCRRGEGGCGCQPQEKESPRE